MSFNLLFCLIDTPFVSLLVYMFKGRIDDALQILLFYEGDVQLPDVVQQQQQQQYPQYDLESEQARPQQIQPKSTAELLKLATNPQSPQYLQKQSATFYQKSFHCNFSQNPNGPKYNQHLVASKEDKQLRKVMRKSNSLDINVDDGRRTNSEAVFLQPTIPTLDTEQNRQAGSKIVINTKLSKIPHQFIGCTEEVIVFETENNQQIIKDNKNQIISKNDLHNIFEEELYSTNHKKSESFSCKKQHHNQYTSLTKEQQKDKLEESKDGSVQTCLICFEKEPDSVFMNCGHGGICYECAILMWKNTSECYLCRQTIVQVYQVDNKNVDKDNMMQIVSKTVKAYKK